MSTYVMKKYTEDKFFKDKINIKSNITEWSLKFTAIQLNGDWKVTKLLRPVLPVSEWWHFLMWYLLYF